MESGALPSIAAVLREAHRGGTFACLEFNKVTNPALAQYVLPSSLLPIISERAQRRIYDQYSFSVIPLLGTIVAGDRASYLVESIRRFPSQG